MPPRRRRFFAAGAMLALGVGTAGGHWLPDWGLRWGVERALHQLGWSRVGIGEADLSLFNGAIVVRQVVAGASLGEALGIGGLDLTFRWRPLLSRRVSVEQLELSGVEVEIRRSGDGFVVNGLPVTVGAGSDGAWSFDIAALTLSASRLVVIDGNFRAAMDIERLELNDLKSWEPAVAARYRLKGRLNGRPVVLEGSATPFAAAAGFALKLDFDGLDLAAFADLAKRAGIDGLAGRASADLAVSGSTLGVRADGNLALAEVKFVTGGEQVAARTLDWRGHAGWSGKVEAAGTVAAAGVSLTAGPAAITAEAARLGIDALGGDGDTLVWHGGLAAERPVVNFADGSAAAERLEWSGQVSLDFKAASRAQAEGRAELADAKIQLGALTLDARKVSAEGAVADAPAEGRQPPLAGRLGVVLDGLAVREPGRDWLAAQHLEARDLVLRRDEIAMARLETRGLAVLGHKGKGPGHYPWRVEARHAAAERVTYGADGGIGAAAVTLGGAMLRVTRTKDGLVGLNSGGGAAGERPALALGRLRLPDAKVEFEDRTPSEPVRLLIEGLDLSLNGLDSRQPEGDAPFTVKARIGAAALSASGQARPFAPHPGGELKGRVRALELPALSPYAADALGVHLHTGQLDADVTVASRQGKLDGGMELVLAQLFVAQPDANAPLAKKADMPLETVLDLLRDSDDRIHLSIPVRGDLDNPDFDVSDAVNQAIGGALKSTVFTTLKVAFPVAALIGFVIDEAENPRLSLEPLAFPPGGDALGEAERAKLSTVAGLLGQRPGLKLTLCGTASQPADWPVLMQVKREEELGIVAKLQKLMGTAPKPETVPVDRDRLAGLADARAQAAKAFLVDGGGIDPGRLFTCRPKLEAEATSGRVDLLL